MAARKKTTKQRAPTFAEDGYIMAHGFRIRLRDLADGDTAYQLDLGRRNGKHERRQFRNLDDAKLEAERRRGVLHQNGQAAFTLTDRQRLDASDALGILEGTGATLAESARFFLEHNAPGQRTGNLSDCVSDYLADMKRRNLRPATIESAKVRLHRLSADMDNCPVHAISKSDLQAWIDGFNPENGDNYRRAVRPFFKYAMGQGYRTSNPATGIEILAAEKDLPTILPPAIVEAIFRAAESKHPRVIPYLSVGFFGGLRPAEAQGLEWEDIDLTNGRIKIVGKVSKTRRSRIVTMPTNLVRWLTKHRPKKASGLIAPPYMTLRRWRTWLADTVGLESWPKDVARHCFASYDLALNQSIDKTALQLGHVETGTLFRHYRGLATKDEAKAFFAIRPHGRAKIIQLHQDGAA